MLHKIIKGIAPIAAMALGAAVSGCSDMDIRINGEEGVPLADLDMSGDPPTGVALLGPDTVIISEGSTLDIAVEGEDEAVDALRFTLSDGTLGVMREKDGWDGKARATVRVTMPLPEDLTMAGSGRIEAPGMADRAEINVAGSGKVIVEAIDARKLEVTMAGSGSVTAAGTADTLEVTVMGSGKTDLSGLKVEDAEVSIAGSGGVSFASDGKVEANIAGSGSVNVTGRATCEVNAIGSGKLTCTAADEAGGAVTEEAEEVAKAEPKAKKASQKKRVAQKKASKKDAGKPRKA